MNKPFKPSGIYETLLLVKAFLERFFEQKDLSHVLPFWFSGADLKAGIFTLMTARLQFEYSDQFCLSAYSSNFIFKKSLNLKRIQRCKPIRYHWC
jgi:hypothetical protein